MTQLLIGTRNVALTIPQGKAPAEVAVSFSKEWRSELPIPDTFEVYNKGFKPSRPEFRDLMINVIALSELPKERSTEFIKIFGLEDREIKSPTQGFDKAFAQFSTSQCFDARSKNLRVMFISAYSPFNDKCPDLR